MTRLRLFTMVFILLLFLHGNVSAAPNLQKFGYNEANGTYYLDLNSIHYINNPYNGTADNRYIEIYEMIKYTPTGKSNALKYRRAVGLSNDGFDDLSGELEAVQYDTQSNKIRTTTIIWVDINGKSLGTFNYSAALPFSPIVPGSVGQSGLDYALSTLSNSPGKQVSSKSGTGFFITSNLVVTNYHVIENSKNIIVTYKNDTSMPATIISKDPQNDLVLLKVNGFEGIIKPLVMGNVRESREGNTVYTVGYPMPEELGTRAKLSEGIINSIVGFKDDLRMFQISIPVQPGNSGGPLLNSKGEVIGVVTAGLGLKFVYNTGILPQNVNYAMKINYIMNFINTLPDEVTLPTNPNKDEMSATRVMEIAKEGVVFITAN